MHESMKSQTESLKYKAACSMPHQARTLLLVVSLLLLFEASLDRAQASPFLMASGQDRAQPLEGSKAVIAGSAHSGQQMSHSKQDINVLEDLIFRAIDDMGDRLKKNKLHSIKQTLRFGRSDPSMAPTSPDDDDLDEASNHVRPMSQFANYDRNYH